MKQKIMAWRITLMRRWGKNIGVESRAVYISIGAAQWWWCCSKDEVRIAEEMRPK